MTTVLDVALDYIRRGWNPVPNEFKSKEPIGAGWQKRVITAESARAYFKTEPQNIGVLLGPTSNGLTDIDLDAVEAAAVAPYLLPITGAIFGRPSKRASHWLYTSDLAVTANTAVINFNDPGGGRLLELRIGGEKGAFLDPPTPAASWSHGRRWENRARLTAGTLNTVPVWLRSPPCLCAHGQHRAPVMKLPSPLADSWHVLA